MYITLNFNIYINNTTVKIINLLLLLKNSGTWYQGVKTAISTDVKCKPFFLFNKRRIYHD